ncbi:MAG: ComF family protein [Nitrospirae bacterium]|nr:ComF family protein [Nitrospirota bacterium]
MRSIVKSRGYFLASKIFNLIYPSVCPVCKKPSDSYEHSPICTACWTGIAGYSGPSCRICATPLASEHSSICKDCMKDEPSFSLVLNYGIYQGALAEAIHLMKFSGLKRLAGPLGNLLLTLNLPKYDGIIPVPLSRKGLRERGFNQTLLLSLVISKELNIPLHMDMLMKVKDTPPQIGLSAKERIKNIKKAFQVSSKIDSLRLVLLDDVMTTGATVRECAKTLIRAGAKDVVVVTLARSSMM